MAASTGTRCHELSLPVDVGAIGSYLLTAATSWSIRDKLIRSTQIATLLNLQNVNESHTSISGLRTWRTTHHMAFNSIQGLGAPTLKTDENKKTQI